MKASFLNHSTPLLVAMVQEATPEGAINTIMNAHYDGAEAFGIQLEDLRKEFRTPEQIQRIFAACLGKPIYITSYRVRESVGMTDDECAALLLIGAEAGATLCDVMGDLYDPQPHELTTNPAAIERQRELIQKLHALGCEVLMSSHTHTYLDADTVLQYAHAQKERGADVVKIVNASHTREQLEESVNMIFRLKRELAGTPFLFLTNGAYCRPIRQLGASFGVCMYLCVTDYRPGYSKEQPTLRAMKAIRDNMLFIGD